MGKNSNTVTSNNAPKKTLRLVNSKIRPLENKYLHNLKPDFYSAN